MSEERQAEQPTADELELARVMGLAVELWNELKSCDWPMTRLSLALAEAEERGRAAALASAQAEGPQWQPIETAPKDREIILGNATTVECGLWQYGQDELRECGVVVDPGWWGNQMFPGGEQPTHWMPLPPAPADAAKD